MLGPQLRLGPSASAQQIDSKYEQVGTLTGTLGGNEFEFVATYNTERERSTLTIRDVGTAVISIQTETIADDGSLTFPGVGLVIGPILPGLPANADADADVTFVADDGFYVSDIDLGGRLPVQNLEYSEASITFSINGTLQPVKRANSVFEIDPKRESQAFVAAFEGVPTLE